MKEANVTISEKAIQLDARGLLCPLPVLKLRKKIKEMKSNQTIALYSNDPAAEIDVPHFCAESGHQLVETLKKQDYLIFIVKIE